MAYNNGFPTTYQQLYPQYTYTPYQITTPQPQMTPQGNGNDSGILWVQGEAGAKSWAVAPGKSVMLMDSERNTFYIKSSDQSGMPMPLRIFDYTERNVQTASSDVAQTEKQQFVTKEELEKILQGFVTRKEIEP